MTRLGIIVVVLLGPTLGVSAFAQPHCPQPSPADIRAALLSVYYFSEAAPQTLPQAWRPINLRRAARILRCDGSRGNTSRRRRAAAKLVGGIIATQGSDAADKLHRAMLAGAIQDLGVPSDLFIQLQSVPHDTRERAERATQRFFDREKLDDFSKGCCSCLLECTAGSDGEVSTVYFKSWVDRDLSSMKSLLDPQQWDDKECSKGFFTETSHAGDTCSAASETDPTTNDPTPGTSWNGVLLENFEYKYKTSTKDGTTKLKNFLDIDIKETDPRYLLEYGLCKPLGGTMEDLNGNASPLGLKEDCGYSAATRVSTAVPNETNLTGVKRLQFDINGLWEINEFGLKMMADTITYEVLCCGSGGETSAENCGCAEKYCGNGLPSLPAGAEPALCGHYHP
jgi:hypothetical protein